jgi:hypothetical protein
VAQVSSEYDKAHQADRDRARDNPEQLAEWQRLGEQWREEVARLTAAHVYPWSAPRRRADDNHPPDAGQHYVSTDNEPWRPPRVPPGQPRHGKTQSRRLTDLSPAVDRVTNGGSGMSFSEGAAAAQAARAYTENEVAGAVLLAGERTDSAGEAVRLAKSGAEHAVAQFLAAWGDLHSGHLDVILRMFAGIQEKLDEMLRALNAVEDMGGEILAALEGVGWATDQFIASIQSGPSS